MELIFVRHGETHWNKKRKVQGQADIKLNSLGIRQAKLLGKRLRKEKIDIVFCSDLLRARHTAREILKYHPNVKLVFDKLLRERSFGIYEGFKGEKLKEVRIKLGVKPYLHRPKGGEDYYDVRNRARKFFREIYPAYKNKSVLIVAHGGMNRALISFLLKIPLSEVFHIKQDNTCVNIAEISGTKKLKVKMHKMNCVRHL